MSQTTSQPNVLASGSAGAVPQILIVDDEQHMCDVCARTLRRSGYIVATTNDPHMALDILTTGPQFDLLLTDIKMPTMSGLDLARIARDRDPTIAIIIMTGFTSFENMQQSVQRGVADFLSKPFELEQLRMAVEQALQKRLLLQDNLRLRTLEHLLASSEALSTTLELTELANILLRETLRQSGCRAGFVLVGESYAPLHIIALSQPQGRLLDAGLALAQRAFELQDQLTGAGARFGEFDGRDLSSAFAVALRAQGVANGVLLLCDDRPTMLRPGVQEEIALIANHASAAFRNATLYGQIDEAYQRLKELDRLKSEFISIASHELRTPLSIVLGYTMMLREQSSGQQHDYAQRVMDGGQRIKEIVDDMVSLRHLETGQTRLSAARCLAQDLVTQTTERLRAAIEERQHRLTVQVPDEPLVIVCDHKKVLLVLGHLVSNAIKFTPSGGQLTIRVSGQTSIPLPSQSDKTITHLATTLWDDIALWVVFEVQDTGIGIAEREQARIFDRFYQVADSLTRDHGGTGLGLAIVRELVAALGGAVWMTSQSGVGSTFAFALPQHLE